jgi:hypothetical protein
MGRGLSPGPAPGATRPCLHEWSRRDCAFALTLAERRDQPEKRGVRVVPSYIRIGSMTTIPSTMKAAASTKADP